MNPDVTPFYDVETGSFSYVVADPDSGRCVIVDPVLDYDAAAARTATSGAERMVQMVRARGLRVDWILETHAHADHLSAGAWLKRELGAPIGIGAGICAVQESFREIYNLGADFAVDGRQFDRLFAPGEKLRVGALEGEVIPTPGHTNDSVSYRFGDALFVGDTLFMPDGGSARCDFPGGSAQRLYQSVQRLYELPADTRVFVCHDYRPGGRPEACQSSVAQQRASNIHLRDTVRASEFVAMRTARDATLGMPRLILPAIQVNIRAGALPPPESNGVSYLRIPLNRF